MVTNCGHCGTLVNAIKTGPAVFKYSPVDKLLNSKVHNVPFYCSVCGAIQFPYKAIRDIVFVFPCLPPKFFGRKELIEIPQEFLDQHIPDFGVILSCGPGYYDDKKFHPTTQLPIGTYVVYDKQVPWSVDVQGTDGHAYEAKYMGYKDLAIVVEEV